MSDSLLKIAKYLGEDDDASLFDKQLTAIKANIIDLHWSEKEGTFCDATIDQFEESVLVCHKGYVTLLPFVLGLVDEKTSAIKITKVLRTLGSSDQLWSPHGIRSLSKDSEHYGTDENYWRSPVWININYLILVRLLEVGQGSSVNAKEAGRLYKELRTNLVDTVYDSWKETGFAWEQYDPETGKGQRTQHFTGWTSLIVKILGMPSSAAGGGKSEL